jgi:hypothetical protein
MADAVGEPALAFDLLANETRLDIIRALGEMLGDDERYPMAFSELQQSVGVDDNGKFNYHLQKLDGRFVERTDEGYRLRPPGISVYQAVIAGTYTGSLTVERTEVPGEHCPKCGADVDVWYENARFHLGCQECDELGIRYPIPPGSFDPEDPKTLLSAGATWIFRDQVSMRRGICPYCAGTVSGELTDDREPMDDVGHDAFEMMAEFTCQRCHWSIYSDLPIALNNHPAVVAFFYDHEVNVFEQHPWADLSGVSETVLSTEPWEVSVVFSIDGDELHVVIDEEVSVVDVLRDRPKR